MMTLMGALSTIPTKVVFELNPSYLSLLIPLYFFIFSDRLWATLGKCVSYMFCSVITVIIVVRSNQSLKLFFHRFPNYIRRFSAQTVLHESLIHKGYSGFRRPVWRLAGYSVYF